MLLILWFYILFFAAAARAVFGPVAFYLNAALYVVSFLVPLVGIILFFVYNGKGTADAKSFAKNALISLPRGKGIKRTIFQERASRLKQNA